MLLDGSQIYDLFTILSRSEIDAHYSFAQILSDTLNIFADRSFQISTALWSLIYEGILSPTQRLVVYYVCNRDVFLGSLIERWEMEGLDDAERQFVYHLICGNTQFENVSPIEYLKLSGKQIVVYDEREIERLKNIVKERILQVQSISPLDGIGVFPVICDHESNRFLASSRSESVNLDQVNEILNHSLHSFHPVLDIHPPPPLKIDTDMNELKWINIHPTPQLLGDKEHDGFNFKSVFDLFEKSFTSNLSDSETDRLLSFLPDLSKILECRILSSVNLPSLAEHNPNIAAEVLMKLSKLNSPHFSSFLNTLAETPVTLQSIQVTNRLCLQIPLSNDFLRVYITNCISFCQSTADKNYQNRLVRLVCVFLHSLIKNKILQIADSFIEIQAFCIEFSRIKEAANLFRTLKSIEETKS